MNVLAVGAHFDDIELGCGGTLAKHVAAGDTVRAFVATHSGYSSPGGKVIRSRETALAEGRKAARILGVELFCGDRQTNDLVCDDALVCSVLELVEAHAIDTLYTHWHEDAHQDHRAVAWACIAAGKHVPRVLAYQSNHYDSPGAFEGNFYVDITETFALKSQAIAAHESELGRVGGAWLEVFADRCRVDGYRIGVEYAEVFRVIKYLAS